MTVMPPALLPRLSFTVSYFTRSRAFRVKRTCVTRRDFLSAPESTPALPKVVPSLLSSSRYFSCVCDVRAFQKDRQEARGDAATAVYIRRISDITVFRVFPGIEIAAYQIALR